MTEYELISSLMFILAGGTLSNGGITVVDKPWHFVIIMICMIVVQHLPVV